MTVAKGALAGAILIGLGLIAFWPETKSGAALDPIALEPGCSSCDARHQRLVQSHLSPVQDGK